jgi:septation ring formation regulator EzrA
VNDKQKLAMTTAAPKLNYQEFIKDIYNGFKRITVQYEDIQSKLTQLNDRLTRVESSQVAIHTYIDSLKKQEKEKAGDAAAESQQDTAKLLSMLQTLEDDNTELPAIYQLSNFVDAESYESINAAEPEQSASFLILD